MVDSGDGESQTGAELERGGYQASGCDPEPTGDLPAAGCRPPCVSGGRVLANQRVSRQGRHQSDTPDLKEEVWGQPAEERTE